MGRVDLGGLGIVKMSKTHEKIKIPTYFVIFRQVQKNHEVSRDLDFFVIFPDFLDAQPTKSHSPHCSRLGPALAPTRPTVAGLGRPWLLLGPLWPAWAGLGSYSARATLRAGTPPPPPLRAVEAAE